MRRIGLVLFLCLLVAAVSIVSFGQPNLSENRHFGLGLRFAIAPTFSFIPWPFLGIQITDSFGIGLTGFYWPGVFMVSASLDYRVLDSTSIDLLVFASGAVASGPGLIHPSAALGGMLEYSLSHSSALRASISISTSLTPAVSASYIFYW
jgi:hypothetical protein